MDARLTAGPPGAGSSSGGGDAATPVRAAVLSDLQALLRLEAAFPGDRLTRRQFRRQLVKPSGPLRVAEHAGEIVGYSLLLSRRGSRVARLYSLVVDPARRGRGIGAALLADAGHIAAGQGASEIRLEVRCDNPEAIALYRRCGYTEFARRVGYYDDGVDALRMRRSLV